MSRRALRAAALTVLCGLAMLFGAGLAAAHTRLLSSDPADATSLATPPSRVSLTFNEVMQSEFSTITVVGPGKVAYQTGEVVADRGTVSTAVLPLGPAGRYEIGYRVVSDDGHPVTGSVAFTLTMAGPGPTAPPSSATAAPEPTSPAHGDGDGDGGGGGAPVWPWILGAVVLVGAGVFAALRLGRG